LKRENQELENIIAALSPIESKWRDAYADQVIATLHALPEKSEYTKEDLIALLDSGFKPANTIVQLVLDFSKDEYRTALSGEFGEGGAGFKRYGKDKGAFVSTLIQMGVLERLGKLVNTPVTWRSLLMERLKGGRGSAIKGQVRGRFLENFAEEIVARVFGKCNYSTRCRFTGARDTSTEKADFAIPSKEEARILIEAKAYGATGSKQTDVLGDISRIVGEKRHDTDFLLLTDGVTWKARRNDLRKLVSLQNIGDITKIYTTSMAAQFETDLKQLKDEHGL
jgi:hypothetical protein